MSNCALSPHLSPVPYRSGRRGGCAGQAQEHRSDQGGGAGHERQARLHHRQGIGQLHQARQRLLVHRLSHRRLGLGLG